MTFFYFWVLCYKLEWWRPHSFCWMLITRRCLFHWWLTTPLRIFSFCNSIYHHFISMRQMFALSLYHPQWSVTDVSFLTNSCYWFIHHPRLRFLNWLIGLVSFSWLISLRFCYLQWASKVITPREYWSCYHSRCGCPRLWWPGCISSWEAMFFSIVGWHKYA